MALWHHQDNVRVFTYDKDGVLIWHGMGSGKSFSTISIIHEIGEGPILITCPKTCIKTWVKEFEKYSEMVGDIGLFSLCVPTKGTVKQKAAKIRKHLNYAPDRKIKVVILNYEAIWRPGLGNSINKAKNIRDKGLLKEIKWSVVIADECQKIKAHNSKVSKFIATLESKKRLCLSGTPFPNSPLDAFGIYRFLDKTIFGIVMPNGKTSLTYQRFKLRYAEFGGFENRQVINYINQEELNQKVYSIAHRVRSEDVIELPEFQHVFLECDLGPTARRAYDAFKQEAIIEFSNGQELTASNILTKYLRLAQIASGTVLDDSGVEHLVDKSKLDTLKDLITGIDEPIVIFTRFRAEVRQIREMIEALPKEGERERKVAQLTGGVDERDMFQSGEAEIIIVNLQAGGAGVNELVRARYGIYYSTGYSSGDYEQSLWRIRRPGSDVAKTVFYYHIVARNTLDEVIAEAIQKKMDLVESVLRDFSKDVIPLAA